MATEAVLETLRHLWDVLNENQTPAALIGGLALATWRHPRATRDVDVLLLADDARLRAITANLLRVGFKQKSEVAVDLGDTSLFQFTFEPRDAFIDVQVDLLVATSEYSRQALGRRLTLPTETLGFEVHVLSCEDLIVFKLLAGRVIDRFDAATLIRANADMLDNALLERLAREANIEDALSEARRQDVE